MEPKLYCEQANYLLGIARLHRALLAEYMEAHAEHVTLETEDATGEVIDVVSWEGSL